MNSPTSTPWSPIDSPLGDVETELSTRYDLPLDNTLYDFLDRLRGLGTRDLLPDWTAEQFKKLRDKAFGEAAAIVEDATSLAEGVERLSKKVGRFATDYDFNPQLMAAIFDVDFGPPDELLVPEKLNPLDARAAARVADQINALLQGLRDLPLRERRTPGPVSHAVLKDAVAESRRYWRSQGRGWTAEHLEVAEPGDSVSMLTGKCEQFVADALGAAGFPFELCDLKAAWKQRNVSRTQ